MKFVVRFLDLLSLPHQSSFKPTQHAIMTIPWPNDNNKDPDEMKQPQHEGFSIGKGDSRTATAKRVRCKFDDN